MMALAIAFVMKSTGIPKTPIIQRIWIAFLMRHVQMVQSVVRLMITVIWFNLVMIMHGNNWLLVVKPIQKMKFVKQPR